MTALAGVEIKERRVFLTLLGLKADPILIDVLCWMLYVKRWPVTMTSFFRKGDRGVHGTVPVRGADIRSLDYDDPRATEFEINDNWVYDPKRPQKQVALYHNAGSGYHFHLQTHPNTVFVGPTEEWKEIKKTLLEIF